MYLNEGEGVVGIALENRPDFIACWLGCALARRTSAFINYRLVGASLEHAIHTAAPTITIAEISLFDQISRITKVSYSRIRSLVC